MKLKGLLLSITLLLFFTTKVQTQLLVMPTRTTVEALQTDQIIRVINKGDTPLYLTVTLERIENPGQDPERKTPIGRIQKPEMMFNPIRITLGAKQERNINLSPLTVPIQETLYRLYITPVIK